MDKTVKRHILLLISITILAKLLLIAFLAAIPVDYVGGLLGIPPDDLYHNLRVMNITERPLKEKLGYTFDSQWYVQMSQKGYPPKGPGYGNFIPNPFYFDKSNCVYWWPFLYPLLIRIFSLFMDPIISGLLLTNAASLLAVALFYLVSVRYVNPSDAFKASVLLMMYPFNLAAWTCSYTEPIFLVFALLAWITLHKDKIVWSGFFMMLASLIRFPGLMLFPILTVIYFRGNMRGVEKWTLLKRVIILNLFALPILYWMLIQVPASTGVSVHLLRTICGRYTKYSPLPYASDGGIVGLLATYINLLISSSTVMSTFGVAYFFAYFALLATYSLRNLDKRLMLYSLGFMLFHLLVIGAADSLGRYLGVIWPLFIYYGRRLDSMDVFFFSAVFMGLGLVLLELHTNMILVF
ncbi:MAG: hypothetical protein V1744_00585 [Candidatus Altiarchaeota archaeon]